MTNDIRFKDIVATYKDLWRRKSGDLIKTWIAYGATMAGVTVLGGVTFFLAIDARAEGFALMLLCFWSLAFVYMTLLLPIGMWSTIHRLQCGIEVDEELAAFAPTTPFDQITAAIGPSFTAMLTVVVVSVVAGIASLFAVIPGLIVAFLWWMAPYFSAVHDLSLSESLSRASAIARQHTGAMLGIVGAAWLAFFTGSFLIGFTFGFFNAIVGDLTVVPTTLTTIVVEIAYSFFLWTFVGSAFTSLSTPSSIVGRAAPVEREARAERPSQPKPPKQAAPAPQQVRQMPVVDTTDDRDPADRLAKLDELFDRGLLSEDEYIRKREQILESL